MKKKWARITARISMLVILVSPCAPLAHSLRHKAQEEIPDAAKKQDKQDNKKVLTKLRVKVTSEDASPVQAAQVDVTSEEEGITFHKVVRTGHDGIADLEVPRGKVLVQVTAPHCDIAGSRVKLKESEEKVEIKLARRKPPVQ